MIAHVTLSPNCFIGGLWYQYDVKVISHVAHHNFVSQIYSMDSQIKVNFSTLFGSVHYHGDHDGAVKALLIY